MTIINESNTVIYYKLYSGSLYKTLSHPRNYAKDIGFSMDTRVIYPTIVILKNIDNKGDTGGTLYMEFVVSFKDEDKKQQLIKYKSISKMDFIVDNIHDDNNDLVAFCKLQYKMMTEFIFSNCLDFRNVIQFHDYNITNEEDFLKGQSFYDQ